MNLLITNIKTKIDESDEEIFSQARKRLRKIGILADGLSLKLYKRSIDARERNNILFVSSVVASAEDISLKNEALAKRLGIEVMASNSFDIIKGNQKLFQRPVVVGFGPAGMFCALLLAENGYSPIVVERGADVFERERAVKEFYKNRTLDLNSNIQFGAGGAGTFSDGKLVTRINDEKCSYVLKRLFDFGAPEEILYKAKPHIGTDILRYVVSNIADEITRLGGEIRYNTCLQEIRGNIAITNNGEIPFDSLVLAVGHSARDTYSSLCKSGFSLIPKPFSVGVRIEHLQADIDKALFGDFAGNSRLGKGEYNLSDTKGDRGVYTFCMCPGGEVVCASSEEGGVVVNGMSHYARDGRNANSAIAVSVLGDDYGNTVDGAINFQRQIERAAFSLAGSNYNAPTQTVGDFLNDKSGTEPTRILPSYMEGNGSTLCDLSKILPSFVTSSLKRGILSFDRRISGFASPDALLTGVETRTSAPVRILRNEALVATSNDRVYPCGEGAGYAGGITSAAVDGIKVALKIIERFAPYEKN